MATIKKAQKGMTMKQLKRKYPSADTTARGDVRGTEINAYAPKKVLQKYNDTYNAFERKFKGGPAKDKKGGVVKKAQAGKSLPFVTKYKDTISTKKYPSGDMLPSSPNYKGPKGKLTMTPKKSMKTGGTLAPSKKSVGKTFGKLNKAKYGSKTSKKK